MDILYHICPVLAMIFFILPIKIYNQKTFACTAHTVENKYQPPARTAGNDSCIVYVPVHAPPHSPAILQEDKKDGN